jgi:hypothetical protein
MWIRSAGLCVPYEGPGPTSRTLEVLIAALSAVRPSTVLQHDKSSNERRMAYAGAAYGPT